MASDTPDPAGAGDDVQTAFRDMLEQWLSLSNDFASGAFGATSGAFGALDLAQVGGLSDSARQTVAETIGRVMTGMNLPNRAEILEIGVQVVALDARLARIEALLARLVAGRPEGAEEAPRPRRTRRPP